MLGLGLHISKTLVLASSGVTPLMAADPIVWYNEDSLSNFDMTAYADSYIDQSGNQFNLAQPDGNKQPQVVDDGNGRRVLFFTNDFLFESDLPVLQGNVDFTIMYVGANLSIYHTAIYIGDNDTPDNTSSFRLGRSTSNNLRGIVGDNANGAWTTPYSFVDSASIAYAYKKGTDSSDIRLGYDNGTINQEQSFGISGLNLSFGDGIGIATNNPDDPSVTGTGLGWFLYEVLVYDRALTETELAQTRQYLREKWNM